jgi:hypothetical protein
MINKTQKGNRNRDKTKKYYEALGYDVTVVEQAKFFNFGGRMWCKKKDCFGADLLAMDGKEMVFIQCKSGTLQATAVKREFDKWKYPISPVIKKVVVCWKFRARQPIIKEI